MELTYRMIGADGRTYGPTPLAGLQNWIQEGRVIPETKIARSDDAVWRPAAQLTELIWPQSAGSPAAAATGTAPVEAAASPLRAALLKKLHNGASWFFWIAALSVVNTGLILLGSETVFILGLGITQVFDVVAKELGGIGPVIALGLDAAAVGLFVAFGVCARKGKTWAIITGMVLYGLDGLLSLIAADWLGLGFHVLALVFISQALKAGKELKALGASGTGAVDEAKLDADIAAALRGESRA